MTPQRVVHPLASAVNWIAEVPAAGWLLAAAASTAAALGRDPFTWALGMLLFASAMDYVTGVATARAIPRGRPGAYDPERRARGRREKIITVILMVGVRMLEGMAATFGLLNLAGILRWLGMDELAAAPAVQQGGIISAIITILIALEELASVYKHRLDNGGSRILLLELAFGTARAMQSAILGKVTARVAAWADGDEAVARMQGTLVAVRKMDDAGHAATHDGEPAPARRHYDAAVEELGDGR